MVAEIFNILGFHIPGKEHARDAKQNGLIVPSLSIDDDAHDRRLYTKVRI